MSATKTKSAPSPDRLRTLAAGLQGRIDNGRRDRNENTPKRQREATAARLEANHLERVQRCFEKLAELVESNSVPPIMTTFPWTKVNLSGFLRTKLDTSGGYYSIRDTGEYHDKSPEGRAVQQLLEASTPEQIAADGARKRREKIQQMENDLKFCNIPGFFPTPPAVVAKMIEAVEIFATPGTASILEPSAGLGSICDALVNKHGFQPHQIDVCEKNWSLQKILLEKGYHHVGDDFLLMSRVRRYDIVLMNPPFENGQDAAHVRHAYQFVEPGGRLVAIMSEGPFFRDDRASREFREWLDLTNHFVERLGDAFKGSDAFRQTGVSVNLVVIDKPE